MNTEAGMVPYTDDHAAHRWFADKLNSIRSEVAEMARAWDELVVGSSWLALETLKIEAPSLTPRSIEQVLEIRERLAPELMGFRYEMEKFGARLAATPWEPAFSREVARMIASDIEPTLRELQQKSEDLRRGSSGKA
jgi:hypothetical protein